MSSPVELLVSTKPACSIFQDGETCIDRETKSCQNYQNVDIKGLKTTWKKFCLNHEQREQT